MKNEEVHIQEEKLVYDGFFKLKKAKLKYAMPDGEMSPLVDRLCFERRDAVAAVVYLEDEGAFLFTRQFRYPTYEKTGGWLIELAAGIMEDNESPEATIKREILEELGYEVDETQFLTTFYVSPGGTSERNHLYFCKTNSNNRVQSGGGAKDENEGIEIIKFSKDEIKEKLKNNDFIDVKTILGLMMALQQNTNL